VPFLNPVTRDKMCFNPDLLELIPREQLDANFGGDYEFAFECEVYLGADHHVRSPFSSLLSLSFVWGVSLSPLLLS
jgi:hypothetical protein